MECAGLGVLKLWGVRRLVGEEVAGLSVVGGGADVEPGAGDGEVTHFVALGDFCRDEVGGIKRVRG